MRVPIYRKVELNSTHIKKIKRRNSKVINELYLNSFSVLKSYAARYKHNEDDQMTLINNAFMKVIDNIDKYKAGSPYKTWITQIIKNEVIDDYRKNKKRNETIELDIKYERSSQTSEIDELIEKEQLEYYLNALPSASRMVFNLYVIEGYNSKEICEELEIGYETFKWHLKEARKRLRMRFKQEELIENGKAGS